MAKNIKSNSVARVFPKVLRSVNHVALAPKIVDSMGYTLGVNTLLSTSSKIFFFLEAEGVFNTILKHRTRFLTERRVLFVVRLCILFPK